MNNKCRQIMFPCLMAIGSSVPFLTEKDAKKLFSETQVNDGRVLKTVGSSVAFRIHFIVDRDGLVRDAREIEVRRAWLKSLAWLYDFSERVYELEPGTTVTVGDLKVRIAPFSVKPSRSPELISYLTQFPDETPFDGSLMDRFCSSIM